MKCTVISNICAEKKKGFQPFLGLVFHPKGVRPIRSPSGYKNIADMTGTTKDLRKKPGFFGWENHLRMDHDSGRWFQPL